MRISTSLFYKRATDAMLNQQAEVSKTELQLSSGKRILKPSDDPMGVSRIMQFNRSIETVKQYQENVDFATSRLELEEGSLEGMVNILQRGSELAVQGNNDSMSATDRVAIAAEMHHLLDGMLGLANSQDANGEYLFSGYQRDTKPFSRPALNDFIYSGDQGQRQLQVSSTRKVADGDSGYDLFVDVETGPFATGSGVAATSFLPINDGELTINGISVGAIPAAVDATERAYQIAAAINEIKGVTHVFVDVELPDRVVLSSSYGDITINALSTADTGLATSVIPATTRSASVTGPAATTFAAINAGDLTINGTSVGAIPIAADAATRAVQIRDAVNAVFGTTNVRAELVGTDQVQLISSSDDIVVATASPTDTGLISGTTLAVNDRQRNIFETLYQLATELEADNSVDRYIADVQLAMDNILNTQATVGARRNVVDEQNEVNSGSQLILETYRAEIEDLDYTEAISRMNQQMIALQAAQKTYIQVQGQSLFDYL
jgi:flagellar hook-associated protein 3 FlgL